jgi:hypothetical protein
MELRLVEQTSPAATPPIRKARRRSLGGRAEKPAPLEVPVTGPVECDRHYTLVARSEELIGDGELRVRHASEADPDAEQQKLTSATGTGAPPKKPTKNKNHSNTKKKKVDSAASSSGDEEEEELQVIEEDDEAEEEGQPSGKPIQFHFVWQLKSSPGESEGEGDRGDQIKDKGPAPEPLPINAAKLQLLSHDSANGEARLELKISSAHFGEASSPSALTHVALEASARKDQPPLRFQSPAARATAVTGPRQADALLPLAVKAKPTTDAGRAPSPRQLPPTVLGVKTSGEPAEDVAASSAATSGSMPSLLPSVLPPLHSVPLPLGPFPIHPAATNGAGQPATSGGGDMWADFASTVKAATLKSLQKGTLSHHTEIQLE